MKIKLFLVLALLIISGFFWKSHESGTVANAESLITAKISYCHDQGKQNSCYKDAAYDFVDLFSPDLLFSFFANNENDEKIFQACHTILHFLGQGQYQKSKNLGEVLSNGDPVCFSGFYHGALEGYLEEKNLADNPEALTLEVPHLCGNKNKLGNEKKYDECLHGLGHALMYATDSDLPFSLKLCDALPEDKREWCYSGAFMENSTSSTNKDHPSKYLKADDPMYPCNILEKKYLAMCYILQGFYFAEISSYDWNKTGQLCLKVPAYYRPHCFTAIGQSLVGFTRDLKVMNENCELEGVAEEYKNSCRLGVVGALGERYSEPQLMFDFCSMVPGGQTACIERADKPNAAGGFSLTGMNVC